MHLFCAYETQDILHERLPPYSTIIIERLRLPFKTHIGSPAPGNLDNVQFTSRHPGECQYSLITRNSVAQHSLTVISLEMTPQPGESYRVLTKEETCLVKNNSTTHRLG